MVGAILFDIVNIQDVAHTFLFASALFYFSSIFYYFIFYIYFNMVPETIYFNNIFVMRICNRIIWAGY
jgi:hypothetical protein